MKYILTIFILFFSFNSLLFANNISKNLKIATYNIRNFGNKAESSPEKLQVITQAIKNLGADLIAFEEVVMRDVLKNLVLTNFSEYTLITSNCGGGGVQHLAFMYKRSKLELLSVLESNIIKIKDPDTCYKGTRPLFIAKFKLKSVNKLFTAIAIHLKAGGSKRVIKERHSQLDILNKFLKNYSKQNVVLLGDFNTTEYLTKNEYYEHFTRVFETLSYKNLTAQQINCSSYWWGGDPNDETQMHPSLLDHIIVSPDFFNNFKPISTKVEAHCKRYSCKAIPVDIMPTTYTNGSDHCPVMVTYKL